VEILKRLHEAVRRKWPELWPRDRILHHDNAINQFLAQKSITETEHPPFFPGLVPNDFGIFPEIKSALKGQKFQDMKTSKQM
jgi:hypothetical protein